jgi:hypothetical protein
MPSVNFLPSRDGFHFANSFANVVNLGLGKITTRGRCGGMAYAALDYRAAGLPIPTCMSGAAPNSQADDFSSNPNDVPPDGTALADFIYNRLFDSFAVAGVQTVQWDNSPDHSQGITWGGIGWPGVIAATKTQQWPSLQKAIDAGNPVVITMITAAGGLGDCHQVVAYGYTINGNTISVLIYDNNYPDDDTITINSTIDGTNPHWNEYSSKQPLSDVWRGWFIETGYSPKTPPFADIHMASAISVMSPLVGVGMNSQKLTATFSVTNDGPYPAHFQTLQLLVTDANGTTYPGVIPVNQNATTIQPGATAQFSAQTPALNLAPGHYTLTAQFQTLEGYWTNVVPSNGIPNTIPFQILQGLNASLSVGKLTPAVRNVPGGVQGGYNLELTGQASGFTGPINWEWTIDGDSPSPQTANGQSVNVFVPVGNNGGPFQYSHSIGLTASFGQEIATASYELNLPQPGGSLVMDQTNSEVGARIAPPPPPRHPVSHVGATPTGFATFHPVVIGGETYTGWETIAVAAETQALFAPVNYVWNGGNAKQAQTLDNGTEAVFQMPLNGSANQLSSYTSNLQVSLAATDAIGQKLSLNGTFPAVTVTYVKPANWEPIRAPGAEGAQPASAQGRSSVGQAVVFRQPARPLLPPSERK